MTPLKQNAIIYFKSVSSSLLVLGIGLFFGYITGLLNETTELHGSPIFPSPFILVFHSVLSYASLTTAFYFILKKDFSDNKIQFATAVYFLQILISTLGVFILANFPPSFSLVTILLALLVLIWVIYLFRRISEVAAYILVPTLMYRLVNLYFIVYININLYIL